MNNAAATTVAKDCVCNPNHRHSTSDMGRFSSILCRIIIRSRCHARIIVRPP